MHISHIDMPSHVRRRTAESHCTQISTARPRLPQRVLGCPAHLLHTQAEQLLDERAAAAGVERRGGAARWRERAVQAAQQRLGDLRCVAARAQQPRGLRGRRQLRARGQRRRRQAPAQAALRAGA